MRGSIWLVAAVLVAVLVAGCTDQPTPRPGPLSREAEAAPVGLDWGYAGETVLDLARRSMETHEVPALALAVVHRDTVVLRAGLGEAEPDTLFPVGSLTKPLTALAVLRAVAAGRLRLEDTVSTHVPGFASVSTATVRQVLAHQGGLSGDWLHGMWSDDPPDWREIVTELAATPMPHPPGEVSVYSNAGYAVLGLVLEKVESRPYEQLLRREVLEPLGMPTATFTPPDGVDEPQVRLVPAGGLYASADDMVQLLRFVLGRGVVGGSAVLDRPLVDAMFEPQNQELALDLDLRRGLGWLLTRAELGHAGRIAWHTGWTPGHHAQLMVLPEHELGVVVLARSATAGPVVDAVAIQALESALALVAGLDPPDPAAPPLAPPMPRPDLQRFAGRYATDMSTLTIEVEGDVLRSSSLAGSATLLPLLDGTFDVVELAGVRVAFERIGGRDLLVYLRRGMRGFLAQRLPDPGALSAAWTARLGPYELVDELNPIGTGWRLEVLEGRPVLRYDGTLEDPATPVTMVLRPVNDVEAIVEGLGRSKGDHVHADGDELRWAGYRLRRTAQPSR